MSLKYLAGKTIRFMFTTNSAIWFERNLTEKLVEYKPKIPVKIDMNSTNQTIEWLKNQKDKWVINPKEIAAALNYNHCWPSINTNGKIIGCIKVGYNTPYISDFNRVIEMPDNMAFIYDSYILKEYRDKNLVTYLTAEVLKFLKEKGYTRAGVHVPSWNKASIRVCEKLGFKKIIFIKYFRVIGLSILIAKPNEESSMFREGRILKGDIIYE